MNGQTISTAMTSGGIPVVVEEDPGSGSFGCMIGVATGSRDETEDIFGLSHLLEHTVFRETSTRDSYQMAKEIEGAGGEMNAFTGREMTAFYGVTISETARVARELVGDIVADPLINEEDTELEKKIVLQELSMIKNEPDSYIHDLFSNTLWRGHPLSQDEGGLEEVVAGLTHEDLRRYYEEKYRLPNLAVFAAGNADLDETVGWAESALDSRSGGARNRRSPPRAPGSIYRFERNTADHYQIAMGFPAYSVSHRDRLPVKMLAAVLGSGTSSRLFQSVRERKALVYSVFSTASASSDAGSIATFMSCTEGNVIEAMETAASVFSELLREGLEKGELERAKRLVKGSNIRSMESTEHRLYRMGVNYMLDGSTDSFWETLAKLDAVTEDDVMRVAGDVLRADRLNTVVLGADSETIRGYDASALGF